MTIADLNARFAVISIGNKVVVMETETDDGSIRELWPFDEFKRLLIKERLRVKNANGAVEWKQAADVWLRHKQGRRYERLVYAMPGSIVKSGPNDYNGYLGFARSPNRATRRYGGDGVGGRTRAARHSRRAR
jgi:hypothetical protein